MDKEQIISQITEKLAEVQQVDPENEQLKSKVSEVEQLLQQLR
jgi:mannitol/fructose-specific phosphotransferase system IIA component (Ntr-type)